MIVSSMTRLRVSQAALTVLAVGVWLFGTGGAARADMARGVVFDDRNGNGGHLLFLPGRQSSEMYRPRRSLVAQ